METEPPSETDILNLMYGIDNETTVKIEISDCDSEVLESVPSTPHSTISEGQSRKRKTKRTISDGTIDKNLRLPTPCPLPSSFSPCVTKAIQSNNVKERMRTTLLREASLFYWEMCQRPTRDEYRTIAKTLCDKYPQLKDKKPSHGRYWESVLKYFIQRYKNIRRPPKQPLKKRKMVFNLDEVPSDGSMSGDDTETSPILKEVEDTTEYDRSMDELNKELSEPIQRVVVIRSLMESTFTKRRKDITMCSYYTAEIKDKYQFLKHKKWVLTDLELVCGKGIIERIERNWEKYAPKILQLQDDKDIEDNKKDLRVLQLLDNKLRANNVPAAKQPPIFSVYKHSTTSLALDTPFSEPRLIIFSDGYIVSRNTQAFIVAEGDVLFEIDNFTVLEGLISLIASYFVFNVKYPKSSRPASAVLLLIQEVLMEMEANEVKKTFKYTNLINSIED